MDDARLSRIGRVVDEVRNLRGVGEGLLPGRQTYVVGVWQEAEEQKMSKDKEDRGGGFHT